MNPCCRGRGKWLSLLSQSLKSLPFSTDFISMDTRSLVLLLVVSSCWCCNARDLTANHVSGTSAISTDLQSHDKLSDPQHMKETGKIQFCSLCEQFATEALNYLSDNKTQTEIISILHKSCSKIRAYEEQCILLVDYYAPLFFLEASKLHADDFCEKFGLCEETISISQHLSKGTCDTCHDVVAQALLKLKDPDTELEIVQMLLKACESVGKSASKCKKLVFEYAPLILVNAEQFLETKDVCVILHACDSIKVVLEEVSVGTEAS